MSKFPVSRSTFCVRTTADLEELFDVLDLFRHCELVIRKGNSRSRCET